MKVKIIKSSGSQYWYKERIGKVFDVIEDPVVPKNYMVSNEQELMILKTDCEIVEDSPPASQTKEVKPIASYPIEDLIKWRNTASKRVTKADEDIRYIENSIEDLMSKAIKINKKKLHDIKWIKKLNRILENKVFNERY